MYGFITHTWNPLAGECPNKCSYCSTNKLKRYPLLNDKYSGPLRLELPLENLGSGKFIFVCAQNDLFAVEDMESFSSWVETLDRVEAIHEHIAKFPENKYLIQSKSMASMSSFYETFPEYLSDNIVICTTIEGINDIYDMSRALLFNDIEHKHKHITIEPIMKFQLHLFVAAIELIKPEQINIGADSGKNNLPEPTSEEIHQLIDTLENRGFNVHIKNNLKRLL